MPYVKKVKIKGKDYWYLFHTIREGNKFLKRSKYLGKDLPKDVEELKVVTYHVLIKEWRALLRGIHYQLVLLFQLYHKVVLLRNYLRVWRIEGKYLQVLPLDY